MSTKKFTWISFAIILTAMIGPLVLDLYLENALTNHEAFQTYYTVFLLASIFTPAYFFSRAAVAANDQQMKAIALNFDFHFVPRARISFKELVFQILRRPFEMSDTPKREKYNEEVKRSWSSVKGRHGDAVVSLQSWNERTGHGSKGRDVTQLTLELPRDCSAEFRVYRTGWAGTIEKIFDAPVVALGCSAFEREFIVTSSDSVSTSEAIFDIRREFLEVAFAFNGELKVNKNKITYKEATDFTTDNTREAMESVLQFCLLLSDRLLSWEVTARLRP